MRSWLGIIGPSANSGVSVDEFLLEASSTMEFADWLNSDDVNELPNVRGVNISFLIHLLRGLTRVTCKTHKSHPCHSIVTLTCNNITRTLSNTQLALRARTQVQGLPHSFWKTGAIHDVGSQTSVLELMHFGDEAFNSVSNMNEGEVRFERAKTAADLVFKNRHTCEQSFARYNTRLTSMPDLKDILKKNKKEHVNKLILLSKLAQHCKIETEDPNLILPESLRDVKDSAKRDMHMLEGIELCDILHSNKETGVDALVDAIKLRTARQLESYMEEKERRVEMMREALEGEYLTDAMKAMFESAKDKPDVLASIILHFATKPIFSSDDLERDTWDLGSFKDVDEVHEDYLARLEKRKEWERSKHSDADELLSSDTEEDELLLPPGLIINDVNEVSSTVDEVLSSPLLLRGSSSNLGYLGSMSRSSSSGSSDEDEEGVLMP